MMSGAISVVKLLAYPLLPRKLEPAFWKLTRLPPTLPPFARRRRWRKRVRRVLDRETDGRPGSEILTTRNCQLRV